MTGGDDTRDERAAAVPDDAAGDRLDRLEVAEDRRRTSEQLDRRFELFEAALLALAAILAAWAGFQSTKWSGEQADGYSRAAAARAKATQASTQAGQQQIVDVLTFNEWLAASQREGLLDDPKVSANTYVPDPTKLSGFLFERFRPELAVAVDAWLKADRSQGAKVASTPFAMPEYHLAARTKADRLAATADAIDEKARHANEVSDHYVLMTITLASVLFFAGISSKMDTPKARLFLLGVGTVLFVGSALVLFSFPLRM